MELAFESDQLPTDLVAVAAVFGVGEEPGDGMRPDLREERRLFDCLEHLNLLIRAQTAEFRCTRKDLLRFGLEISQPLCVDVLLLTIESGQRAIDEVDGAGFARSGSVVGGDNLRSQALHFRGLFRREEFKPARRP